MMGAVLGALCGSMSYLFSRLMLPQDGRRHAFFMLPKALVLFGALVLSALSSPGDLIACAASLSIVQHGLLIGAVRSAKGEEKRAF